MGQPQIQMQHLNVKIHREIKTCPQGTVLLVFLKIFIDSTSDFHLQATIVKRELVLGSF